MRNDIAFVLRRRFQRACHIGEHILNENAIPRGGVVDHHVGDRADELAVPDQGAAAQMCVQSRTSFMKKHFLDDSFVLRSEHERSGQFYI